MAWMLGYIWADGSIAKNQVRLACCTDDEQILIDIKRELKSTHKLVRREGLTFGRYTGRPFSRLVISSKLLTDCLCNVHGLAKCKSKLDLPFPFVPDEFLPHFVRGHFDGDGTVCVNATTKRSAVSFLGTPAFALMMQAKIAAHTGVPKLRITIRCNGKLACFAWARYVDVAAIYRWMYPDGNYLFLRRKKKSFESAIVLEKSTQGKMDLAASADRLGDLYRSLGTWSKVARHFNVSEPAIHLHRHRIGLLP